MRDVVLHVHVTCSRSVGKVLVLRGSHDTTLRESKWRSWACDSPDPYHGHALDSNRKPLATAITPLTTWSLLPVASGDGVSGCEEGGVEQIGVVITCLDSIMMCSAILHKESHCSRESSAQGFLSRMQREPT